MMPDVVGNLMGKKGGGKGEGAWGHWSHGVIEAMMPLEPRGKSIGSYHKL